MTMNVSSTNAHAVTTLITANIWNKIIVDHLTATKATTEESQNVMQ
jgi:hypothetical protein